MLNCYGAQHSTASRVTVVLQGNSWMCCLRNCVTRLPFTCFLCRNKPCVAQLTVRPFAAVGDRKRKLLLARCNTSQHHVLVEREH